MKPRLTEKPRDWQAFTAASAASITLVLWLLLRKTNPQIGPTLFALPGLAIIALSLVRPRWFRPFYRGGMTLGFLLGQAVGSGLLILVFIGVLTPLALLLRILGKDLLDQRPRPMQPESFWKPARNNSNFDQQF